MKEKETEMMSLDAIRINDDNPRSIVDNQFQKLIKSILTFPEMLSLRPIVIDEENIVLGGNMRTRALKHILTMSIDAIDDILASVPNRTHLRRYWKVWLDNPSVAVKSAEGLTEEQKREFIIKDNVAFGEWDWDELANKWDADELNEWGLNLPVLNSEDAESDDDNDDKKTSNVIIEIPDEHANDIELIRDMLSVALRQYPYAKIK